MKSPRDAVGDVQRDPDTALNEEKLTQFVGERTKRRSPDFNDKEGERRRILRDEQLHALGTLRLDEIAVRHERGEL
jgi:hypothetical protein